MGLRSAVLRRGALMALVALGTAALRADGAPPLSEAERRFRQANELARAGDYPKALEGYQELAADGAESASLYWNWAQAASARGALGEALWALLRARELDPGDRAVGREIDRVREAMNLDRAEIAPDPLAAAARMARRFRLDLVLAFCLLLSVLAHVGARVAAVRAARPLAAVAFGLGLLAGAFPLAGSLARTTAVVVRRAAPLLDQASPTAEAVGSLREGEVVPVLDASGDYVRIEDSSGARGWATAEDVRRLDGASR
ncbi:MAG TPA: SH3 domain-containing protein [Vicinamibacteria bacterium]|nr:SH3 domain-containing protein [Vicinamibacteria bacterium]